MNEQEERKEVKKLKLASKMIELVKVNVVDTNNGSGLGTIRDGGAPGEKSVDKAASGR